VNLPECSLSSTNCVKILGQNQFDLPIARKKMKLCRLLKIKGSILMYIVLPLGPNYIGESAKAYGLKVKCLYMENMLGNTLWTWGTLWEPIKNLKGTSWEHIRKQGKLKKKNLSYPPLTWALLLAERKINPLFPPHRPPPIKLAWKVKCPL
jgi:hypothetical protein